ncbi:MAG: PLP-dependent aminotransferase family protein [Microbacterium sp.]
MTTHQISMHQLAALLGDWRGTASDYSSLAERIRLMVIDGRIKAGARLPSERALADHLGISRTTVNSALAELRTTGYVRSRQGSGSVVEIPGRTGDLPIPQAGDLLDLSRATSAAVPGVHAAAERALRRLPARLTTDGYELSGLPALRETLAERYTASGIPTTPENIVITSGSAGAISLIARTLLAPGDRVIVETPGYPHSNDAFRSAGARLLPTIVDGDGGWDAEEFTGAVARSLPTIAYLMPDFHNPTSRSMTPEVREAVVDAASRHGTTIVSDETTADLDIDRPGTTIPLAAYDRRGSTVVTVGSASKTMWGGLRVGWIRASTTIIDRLVAARFSFDLGAAVMDQLIVSELFDRFDDVVDYRRALHRRSREALRDALAVHLPGAHLHPVEGGVAAWVRFDEPVSSALTVAARARGLLIGAGPWFGLSGEFERNIRVPITATPDAIERAVAILAEAWGDAARPSRVAGHSVL